MRGKATLVTVSSWRGSASLSSSSAPSCTCTFARGSESNPAPFGSIVKKLQQSHLSTLVKSLPTRHRPEDSLRTHWGTCRALCPRCGICVCQTLLFCPLVVTHQIKHVKEALTPRPFTALMSYIDSVLVVPVAFMQSALHSCDSAGAAGWDACVVHSPIIYGVHSIFLLSLLYASSLS